MRKQDLRASGIQVALVLAVLGMALFAVSRASTNGGARNSTLVRTSVGFSYWYDALDQLGNPLIRLREPLTAQNLPGDSVLVMVVGAEEILVDEWQPLRSFVEDGGWLITSFEVLETLTPGVSLSPISLGEFQRPPLFTGETQQVRLTTTGAGSSGVTGELGPAIPLLVDASARYAAVASRVGDGRVVGLTSDLLRNGNVLAEDNLRFAVQLAGQRTVVFNEYVQGFEQVTASVPDPLERPWPWILGLLAIVATLWGTGHRFGRPVLKQRTLPPPRVDYVDAMGAALAGGGPDISTYETLRDRALSAVRVGTLEELERRAEALELTPHDVHMLRYPPGNDRALIELAMVVARLEHRLRGGRSNPAVLDTDSMRSVGKR